MEHSSKSLADIYDALPEKDQTTLFEFAEFLKSRAPEAAIKITEPLNIPRPDEESVIAAIKRLKKNYPMIPQKSLLNETSDFMMQHMLHGKPAAEVIDELEVVFELHYKRIVGKAE